MNFELSEEQLLIRESVVKLCADFPDDYWSKKGIRNTNFLGIFMKRWPKLVGLGIAIPEAYGGSGRGITEASLVLEEVGCKRRSMNGLPFPSFVDLWHAPRRQVWLGRDEAKVFAKSG
ncbi:MAG: hypothetical protein Ct9H90mP27_4070 [Gammaproteobacteria bacterium]|nr:MAG: hypothetical protein Ct9H90mP27_4070 [Gammaproteobacteria bacterium]